MKRKTLGIVSSYNEQCGNASYTHVLKEELSKYYDVRVISVSARGLSGRHGPRRLREVCQAVAACDVVNIQFEAGLYGMSTGEIADNICAIIKASRKLLFTMHRVTVPNEWRRIILTAGFQFLAVKGFVGTARSLRAEILNRRLHIRVAQALGAHNRQSGNDVSILVHTAREKELLDRYYGLTNVIDYPITFLNKNQIQASTTNRAQIRDEMMEHYQLDATRKYIGIFGFLSENKGHHIAVEAMRWLPPEYTLLIFGAQHPMTITPYDFGHMMTKPELFSRNSNRYISSLVSLAEKVNIGASKKKQIGVDTRKHRVKFMGALNDEQFIRAITAMDYVVLPYLESGQGGSGNASLVLELEASAIMARNHAFMELQRYYPDSFKMVDMGNPLELARAIQDWKNDYTMQIRDAMVHYNIENNGLLHKEALENGADAAKVLKAKMLADATSAS